MFRLPYNKSPYDLLSKEIRDEASIDMTEAVFGFIKSKKAGRKQGEKENAYGGRVFVTEGVFQPDGKSPWLDAPIVEPKILATPKPTAFQHYLAQDQERKDFLSHYGRPGCDAAGL